MPLPVSATALYIAWSLPGTQYGKFPSTTLDALPSSCADLYAQKLHLIFIGSTIKNIASTFFLNIKNLADCFWKLPIKIKPFLPTSLLLLSFLGPLAIFLTFLGYFHQSRVPKFPMSRNFLLHHAQKSQHSLTLEATPKFWCNLTVTLDMLMAIWIFFPV